MKTLGNYHLEGELGRGAAGVVYLARDADGRRVAVKVLLQGHNDVNQRRRFLREAEALRRLDHPRVVRVRDAGEQDDVPYLVLDYVEGASLAALLERQGPWEPAAAAELIRVLAEALAHAHARGVIHRDVKPENVLVDAAGQPHLTDFGLTRDLDPALDQTRLSKTGVFLGTPAYWPPEQARGELDAIGPWSDIYALGGTLYALLCGGPPHDAQSLQQALQQAERLPAPPSRGRPDVPPALDAICLRCLEPQPSRRYQRAEDLQRALAAFLEAPDPTPSRTPARLAALTVLLGALLAGGLLVFRRAPTPPPAAATPTPEQPASLDAQLEAAYWKLLGLASWDEIEASYQAILERHPDQPGALVGLGALRFEQLRVTEGTRLQGSALRAAPADAWVRLGAALVHAKIETLEGAIVFVRMALDERPDLAAGWVQLSALEEQRGELQASRVAAQRALDLLPDHPLPWIRRGLAQQDRQQALADLRRALALDPTHALGHAALATLLAQDAGAFDEALAHWAQAFDRAPSSVHVYRQDRAELFEHLARLEEAIADLEALNAQLERPNFWLELARLRTRGGWVDEAGAALERAFELAPTSPLARARLADWWRQVGRLDRATQVLGPLFALPTPAPEAHLARALVRLELGDPRGALADLSACAAADPTLDAEFVADALAWLERAQAEYPLELTAAETLDQALSHGDRWTMVDHHHSAAQQGYERALEFDPENPRALAGLALLAARAGDDPRAETLLAQAHRRDPYPASLREAQILAWRGDLPAGLRVIDSLLRDRPRDPAALDTRTRLHLAHGSVEDLLADLQALDHDQELRPLLLRADAFLRLGRFDEALASLDLAFDQAPLDPRLHLRRAEALLTLGQVDAALVALDAYLRAAPDACAYGYLVRAQVLVTLDPTSSQLREVQAAAEAALSRGGYDPRALHALGFAARESGRVPDSLPPLRRAVELTPFTAFYRKEAAVSLRAARQAHPALLNVDAALREERRAGVDTLNDEVLRAWCLFSAGRLDEARAQHARLRAAALGSSKLQGSLEGLRLELDRAQ